MKVDDATDGQEYSHRVSLDEAYEVEYWTRALGATEEALRVAIAQAGNAVTDVRGMLDGT